MRVMATIDSNCFPRAVAPGYVSVVARSTRDNGCEKEKQPGHTDDK